MLEFILWFVSFVENASERISSSDVSAGESKTSSREYSREQIIHRDFLLQACGAFSLSSGYEDVVLLTS